MLTTLASSPVATQPTLVDIPTRTSSCSQTLSLSLTLTPSLFLTLTPSLTLALTLTFSLSLALTLVPLMSSMNLGSAMPTFML